MTAQAVIFLARGAEAGIEAAEAFFASYDAHPAGIEHQLIVLAKGWESVRGRDRLDILAQQHDATVIDLPDDGFDWGAYMRVAPQLKHEWICFLNSHSRIIANDWLAKLRSAAEQPNVGVAGATGCWTSFVHNFRIIPGEVADYRQRNGFAKAAIFAVYISTFGGIYRYLQKISDFPQFPNPFLRTNAFCIRRDLFLSFANQFPIPLSKRETFILECGRRGLTRFIYARGMDIVVVGADGIAYKPDDWLESATFRTPGQQNLLIADNQTRDYERAMSWSRRTMERAAWGRPLSARQL